VQQPSGVLVEHNGNSIPDNGPNAMDQQMNTNPETFSACKERTSGKSKSIQLTAEKSSPCIHMDYEYVNM
jgi:hypothetical protein